MERLFGTDGIRGKANESLTVDFVVKLGLAVGNFLGKKCQDIILGKDTRLSSDMLESAFAAGLCAGGMNVLEAGIITTPGVAFLASRTGKWGAVISASHNPFDENGIKLINRDGYKLPDEWEDEIEDILLGNLFSYASPRGIGRRMNYERGWEEYLAFLKGKANNKYKGLKIVIDPANGAGYRLAPILFSELGADIRVINADPNGKNINKDCGAVHPEGMAEEVVKQGALLGLSLDGDGDRAIFADEKGTIIQGDGVLYILATYMKEKGILRGPVITTYMTNGGVERALRERGIEMIRVPIGDKYVAEKMRETGANLGGEQSGHIILGDHLPTGDGLLTAIKLIEVILERDKPLSQLRDYTLLPQKLVNIRVREPKRWEKDKRIWDIVKSGEAMLGNNGRILVRASGTEEKLRIMVEGKNEEAIEELLNYLVDNIRKVIENG